MSGEPTAVLLVSCPDRQGVVAALSAFVYQRHGNILHLDQHVDLEGNVFFARLEWSLAACTLAREQWTRDLEALAAEFGMCWSIFFSDLRPRMAIFVTREAHCLHDMLARHDAGEWQVDIPLVISNHEHLQPVAARMGIPFHVFPVTADNQREQEARELDLLAAHRVDLVVLARYMRVLSGDFIRHYPDRIINIHHSFLPAFPGAKPYHSAHARGVKIIGATSHYVTAALDDGPIIEQDVIRVSHRHAVADLVRHGKDLEKIVLARAVYWHLAHRILVYNHKTVVFD